MVKLSVMLTWAVLLSGCSTLNPGMRIGGGTVLGAAIGGGAGAVLSPNEESRALNALVFGLTGALVGGGLALWTQPERHMDATESLRSRELKRAPDARDYLVLPEQDLPEFVKRRVQPVVIEEFTEKDSVSEDGTLREPHKAYRIKRPAELLADPSGVESLNLGGPEGGPRGGPGVDPQVSPPPQGLIH